MPRSFTDTEGRAWTVAFTVAAAKRLRDMLHINPFDANQLLVRLFDDPIFLAEAIYCVCLDEANQRGISDEQFGRALAGQAIENARHALLEEYVDFFPEPQKREAIKILIDKTQAIATALYREATEKLKDVETQKVLREISGEQSTKSPAS